MIIPSFRRKQQSQPVEKVFSAGWKTRYKGVGAGRLHPTGAWEAQYPAGGMWACRPSVSKKSFRHAVRIFKLSKKFKNTCRLNAKGAFCPLHTSPAALSQTSSARFFDSLWRHVGMPPYAQSGDRTALHTEPCGPMWASAPTNREPSNPGSVRLYGCPGQRD